MRLHLQDKATPCGRCREDSKEDNLKEEVNGCSSKLIGADFLYTGRRYYYLGANKHPSFIDNSGNLKIRNHGLKIIMAEKLKLRC